MIYIAKRKFFTGDSENLRSHTYSSIWWDRICAMFSSFLKCLRNNFF